MFLVNFGQYIFYYESLSYNFVSTQKEYPPPPMPTVVWTPPALVAPAPRDFNGRRRMRRRRGEYISLGWSRLQL